MYRSSRLRRGVGQNSSAPHKAASCRVFGPFELGLFLPPVARQETQGGVVLERWVRERKDDRDVLRVVTGGEA